MVRGGPEGGPKGIRGVVIRPFTSFAEGMTFKGGERATVIVSGRLDTDADLYVYDDAGNVVAWDDRPSGACAVEWLPERAARFTIEIRNTGQSLDEVEIEVR